MDTNRLAQLRVLAETKNLRKAAEILGISHTGLHKSLRKLEDELGQDLFRAVGRGLELTPYATEILNKIPNILKHIEDLKNKKVSAKPYTLGSFEVFTTHAFPSICEKLSGTPFSLKEYGPGRLEEALLKDEIDLGVTYTPIARNGLNFYSCGPISMGLYCRQKTYEKTPIEELPFVAPNLPLNETPTTVRGLDGWPDHKISRKIVYSVDLMESALALVREGLAVAFIPRFVAQLCNEKLLAEYKMVEIKTPPSFPKSKKNAYIVKKQLQKENDFERKVAKALRQLSQY